MQTPTLDKTSDDTARFQWAPRLRAAGAHLAISLGVAALAAALVFGLWYPWPYRELSGGRELFTLLVVVDVVLGPLITLSVFDRRKPRAELARDLSVVGLLQLAALCYGLWTVQAARPVQLAFEYDRLRVVHRVDLDPQVLATAGAGSLPTLWQGPGLVALRPLRPGAEQADYTLAALQGVSLSARPELWRPWAEERAAILAAAEPFDTLAKRRPAAAAQLAAAARQAGREPATLRWIPVLSRDRAWTALLDAASADIVAFVPVDPY